MLFEYYLDRDFYSNKKNRKHFSKRMMKGINKNVTMRRYHRIQQPGHDVQRYIRK